MALLVAQQPARQSATRQAAWYKKRLPAFSDTLAQVRRALWRQMPLCGSLQKGDPHKSTAALLEHFGELLAYAT